MVVLTENEQVGKYKVDYLIKQSDFCSTYKVSGEDGKAFFMKLFSGEAVPENMYIEEEVAEIVLSRKVSHENVVSRVDDGVYRKEGKNYPYLITDFVNGSLLSEHIDRGQRFTASEAKSIISGVLEGVLYLHSLQLCHNDLSPRNVILQEVGKDTFVPRIIDLGHLSRQVHGITPFPVNDLNLFYCAPETFLGVFSERSDVFSAGAILYTLMAGKVPWDCPLSAGEAFQEKKKKVREARKGELDTLPLKEAGADELLIQVIEGALSLHAKERLSAERFMSGIAGKELPSSGKKEKESSQERNKTTRSRDTTKTEVEIKPTQGGGFKDVAGMESLKADLTNRVIWVLRDKGKAEKYRLTPPNGMILYGPPGCGKTFFAEKFAEETHFNFVLVNGSDLGSVYVHGTQGKIASLFREAQKKAPTIICFDEFDSFVPSRSSRAAEHRSEEVNEFLSQLNNCAQKGIFVIGTTNRIDLIDSAVLRKGRMDLHVEIPAPDEDTRAKMFAIHLKGRPVAEDIDTAELARQTDNYAAADIAFIVNEAAMVAALSDEVISQNHLLKAIKSNRSSLPPKEERRKIGY